MIRSSIYIVLGAWRRGPSWCLREQIHRRQGSLLSRLPF